MKTIPQWHILRPQRLNWERRVMHGLPFFKHPEDRFNEDGNFTVTGTLFCRGSRSGRLDEFQIEIVYPRRFPRFFQRVYDREKRFDLCENGHLFPGHQLCLTLRERMEFSVNAEDLTEEVLGATLVWFDKRLIFERNGRKKWPGPAEAHGSQGQLNFILERGGLLDNANAVLWANELHQRALLDHRFIPFDVYDLCPCSSGKKTKFCHGEALVHLGKLLRRVAGTTAIRNGNDGTEDRG